MGGAQLASDEAAGLLPEKEGEESDHLLVGEHRIAIRINELEKTIQPLVEGDLDELHECLVQRFDGHFPQRLDGKQLPHSIRGRALQFSPAEDTYKQITAEA